MKIGSIVIHKLSGQEMRIKKLGEICVCELIHEPKEYKVSLDLYDFSVALCSIENLIDSETKQLSFS